MTITITIPDALSRRLESQANARHTSVDQLATDLLAEALHRAEVQSAQEGLVKLVEKIRTSSPTNPSNVWPARASLRDLLSSPIESVEDEEPPPSPEEWNRAWASFEAGEKALARTNDVAEDRR